MWSNFRNSSHLSCGEILDVSTWQMWKNSRPLHFCHVWKSEMSPHDRFFSTGTCYKYQSLWVWTGLFVGNPGGRYREPPYPLADNCFNCLCSFLYQLYVQCAEYELVRLLAPWLHREPPCPLMDDCGFICLFFCSFCFSNMSTNWLVCWQSKWEIQGTPLPSGG